MKTGVSFSGPRCPEATHPAACVGALCRKRLVACFLLSSLKEANVWIPL